jgi:hypothetical protein
MKFDDGVIEVSGICRVVFGERGGRQHIYERTSDGNWCEVPEFGGSPVRGDFDVVPDFAMVRAIKGAAMNKRSRVLINGDTVNVLHPRSDWT